MATLMSRGAVLAMLVETACISLQALRGVRSHFNHATAFDDAVFGLMGSMIAFNTVLVVLLLAVFLLRPPDLAAPELVGIRCGIVLMLLASGVGGLMVRYDAHSVGGVDGGPGLPLVGWSVEHGDLRPAHALGLHALQVLPLAGWWATRRRATLGIRGRTLGVAGIALVYAAAFAALLLQALAGRPLSPRVSIPPAKVVVVVSPGTEGVGPFVARRSARKSNGLNGMAIDNIATAAIFGV